jgi:UDP-N-acetylmuramate-alanine ligase
MLTSLKALGAEIFIGHASENLGDAQMVIISSAINESNEELVAAKAKGLPVIARATALAWLMSESTSVAIAGTHGKTTTTAMLTVALQSAGLDPSFAIGGKYLLLKLMSPMALFWHINPLARLLPTLSLIMLTISLTKMPFSLFLNNL